MCLVFVSRYTLRIGFFQFIEWIIFGWAGLRGVSINARVDVGWTRANRRVDLHQLYFRDGFLRDRLLKWLNYYG